MSDLDQKLSALASRFDAALSDAPDEKALDDLRVAYLGRSGEIIKSYLMYRHLHPVHATS